MAVNNPLNTLLPAAQSPSAASFPGAGQASSFGPGQQQFTLQNLGQQPQGQQQPAVTPLPQLIPYIGMQPYYSALGQQPQAVMPQVSDPTLQAIQQKLQALQATTPLLQGAQPPHPQSVLAKQQAPMSPLQIVGAAGQQLWNQEVVKPVQDYIKTWQTNPMQALAETALGLGTIAAVVGLEAVTGGAATPVIFAAFGAMAAPAMVQSWAQEVTDPTDGHLVQALVSTGSGVLSVGSPVRAFKGIQVARGMLDTAMAARKDIADADAAAGLLLGGRAAARDIRTGAPLEKQIEVLSPDPEVALHQFEVRGASTEEGTAAAYMAASRGQQALRQRLQTARDAGDLDTVKNLLQEIRGHAKETLAPATLAASYDHLFIPSTPYTHVPKSPLPNVPTEVQDTLDEHEGAIRGLMRELHSGNALQGLHEAATRIDSVLEQGALDRAAGTAWDMGNRVLGRVEEMARAAGLDGLNDSRVEDLMQALEEPEKWQALVDAEPEQAAFAQKLRNVSNILTAGELKFGTVALPLLGRVAHYVRGTAGEQEAEPIEMFSSWWKNPTGSRSRFWRVAVNDETGAVTFLPRTRAAIIKKFKDQTEFYEATHEHRQLYVANRSKINALRRRFGQLEGKRGLGHDDPKVVAAARAKIDQMMVDAHNDMGHLAPGLIGMEYKQLKKLRRAAPATQELVTGGEAVRQMLARHMHRMHMAVIGDGLRSHANLNMQRLAAVFGETPMKTWGAAMELPSFKSRHNLPDIVEDTVFLGQGKNAGSVEDNAQRLGYFQAHPAVGRPGDLHHRPALYARGDLANKIRQAEADTSAAGLQNGILDALYKISGTSKRYVMYNPLFHRMNTAGRAFSFLLNDPVVARSAFNVVGALKKDSEAYYALLEEAGQAGMVHANQWNVSHHLQLLQREEDGQHHFLGAVRNFGRAINDWHSEHLERGLWNSVDNTQLAAYTYMKTKMAAKGIPEVDARRASAQYANMLGGMVNPLYMNRMWRHLKGLVWFAPSYWATFLHSLQSMVPGAARLSQFMAGAGGGRFVRMSAVPLKALDYRARVELVRAQRSWMLTYLSTAAVSMDMMNVMFSGHHLWDNAQGHQFDIDVTNLTGTSPVDAQHSEPKPAYITTMPFFRQAVDVANAIGLGQDYGFAHNFSDATWQKQDAFHKASMAMGALVDGVRREAAGKVGAIPQALYEGASGQSFYGNIGQGVNQPIERWEALASLVPSGYQVQRIIKQYQQNAAQATGQQPGASTFWQDATIGMLSSLVGVPSIYHMGVETPPIDDSKYQNWQSQRTSIHDQMVAYSNQVFTGGIAPAEYSRHKHDLEQRLAQLDTDTWGDSSPGASLAAAYTQLSKQFGLDNQALSDDQWFELYDAFLPAWNQMLQAADPSSRAAWWEHHTQQWTDADYLEWEAQQLKEALAGSIDGQNGAYIRAVQNQLYQLKPYMSAADFKSLEDSDPAYSAYRAMLQNIGLTSPLGAFVSAFSSPFSTTTVLPTGMSPEQAQEVAGSTGGYAVRAEEAQGLAQQARQVAQEPQVAQAGGDASASPELQQAVQAAEAGV
jgi:hypothetical protein